MQANLRPALLLNADFKPVSQHPLSLLGWQDAIKAVFLDRVSVVEEYDVVVRSPGSAARAPTEMRLPSVVALRDYQKLDRAAAFTRMGVLIRDRYRCAYCGERLTASSLTFDHVVPRSKGGRTRWRNIVAACQPCNLKKANKTLLECGLKLRREPYVPTKLELNEIGRQFPPSAASVHPSWHDYLGVDRAALESPALVDGGFGNVFPTGMTSEEYWAAELLSE
jgi:5-methylcytosine-specific restriction endonuclease McrA